jgi:hypothetical protein
VAGSNWPANALGLPPPLPTRPEGSVAARAPRTPPRRFVAFLRAHPGLCLILLSPGIPEYLSGSSPLSAVIVSPGWFVLQLVLNLGLYAPGVLLIREARVRWNKGWGTVVLLGAAYAIVEEGIALSTMFNPRASVVGVLGFYGHWAGVNWVWTAGLLMVHIVYSIALPILILALAFPETEGRSLLRRREIVLLLVALVADVALLFTWVYRGLGFWMTTPVLVGSLAAIGVLALAAYLLPKNALRSLATPRTMSFSQSLGAGLALFPVVLVIEGILGSWAVPAAVTFFVVLAWEGLIAYLVVRYLSASGSERAQVAFALGAIIPLVPFGIVAGFPFDVVLVADALVIWLFVRLLRKYQNRRSPVGTVQGGSPHLSLPTTPS